MEVHTTYDKTQTQLGRWPKKIGRNPLRRKKIRKNVRCLFCLECDSALENMLINSIDNFKSVVEKIALRQLGHQLLGKSSLSRKRI